MRLEERETHLNMTADNRGVWHVYTDDPVMMRRIEKLGVEVRKEEHGGGRHYELKAEQVLLRKGKRPTSDAQRAALARAREKALAAS